MEGEGYRLAKKEMETESKGIAFVFSHWVEKNNPTELSQESQDRLEKAVELYQANKIAYILVSGGEFVENLEKPVAKMMTDYLELRGVPQGIIIEERHSKDTTSNVRFGKFLLGLKKLDDLPVYYISSGYHLKRIKTIVDGQERGKSDDKYISSGRDELSGSGRLKEIIFHLINRYDPGGESVLAKYMRRKRSHPIRYSEHIEERQSRLDDENVEQVLLDMVNDITDEQVRSTQRQLQKDGFTAFDEYDEKDKKLFIVLDKLTDYEIHFLMNLKIDYLRGLHDFKMPLVAYVAYCRSQKKRKI